MIAIALRALQVLAVVALAAMAVLTVADIFASNLFNRPIRGTYEVVSIGLLLLVSAGLPEVFLRSANVDVEIADVLVGETGRRFLVAIGAAASFVFMVLVAYAMAAPLADSFVYVERMQETQIAFNWLWVVLFSSAVITALAALAAMVRAVRHISEKNAVL